MAVVEGVVGGPEREGAGPVMLSRKAFRDGQGRAGPREDG